MIYKLFPLFFCFTLAGCDQTQRYEGECINPGATPGTKCGDKCTSLQTDPDNCGACGQRCKANEACQNGQCTTQCSGSAQAMICDRQCAMPYDYNNCGGCGIKCSENGGTSPGTPVCVAEYTGQTPQPACKICQADEVYCYGQGTNTASEYLPACANLKANSQHCGACGHKCDPSSEFCSNGQCVQQGN